MSQVQSEEVLTSRSPPPLSTTEKVFDTEKTLREIGRALGYLKSNPSWWTRIYTQCFQVVNAMAKAKEPQPQLCNLLQAALELALSVDKDCVLKLAGEEADAFMCLVQKAIDFTPHGHKSRGHFMKILMDVAIHSHVFPRILTLDDITDRSEHPLYAGGFGDVWRASWRGRSVALKSPRLTLAMNDAEKAHKNLCREVLLWRQLNHPHLLEFLGVCKYSSLYTSIVSPWMENGTVLNFVKACPKVDRIKLLKQVASALSYLHEHDPPIVHQDVRGINILVNDKQDAVLGDFGLSRIDNNFFASMASTMQHGCTRWQAPELLFPPSGEIPSTSWATDMWSFGMVVLELFTECLPFAKTAVDSAVIIDIYHGRKPDRPVDSEVKAPGLSDRVWACAEKCWAKSPSDRPRASVLVSQLTEELAAENTTSIDAVPDAISAQGFSRRAPPSLVATLWRSVRARRRVPSRETRILLPDVDIPAITTAGESKLSSPQLASPTAGRDEESSNEPVCSKSQTVQHGALRIGEPTQMVNNYVILMACSLCCMVWLGLLAMHINRPSEFRAAFEKSSNGPVCSNCTTRSTPLWRTDPHGQLYVMLVACTISCIMWFGHLHSEQLLSRKGVRKTNEGSDDTLLKDVIQLDTEADDAYFGEKPKKRTVENVEDGLFDIEARFERSPRGGHNGRGRGDWTKHTSRRSIRGSAPRKQFLRETPIILGSHHSDDASSAIPSPDLVQRPLVMPRSPLSEEGLYSVIVKGTGVEQPTPDFRQGHPTANRPRTSKFACLEQEEVDNALRPSRSRDCMGKAKLLDDDVSPTQRYKPDGEDSVHAPAQSRSPSVHPGPELVDDPDLFDGYSFKGRNSILIDDEDEPKEAEYEFNDEVSVLEDTEAAIATLDTALHELKPSLAVPAAVGDRTPNVDVITRMEPEDHTVPKPAEPSPISVEITAAEPSQPSEPPGEKTGRASRQHTPEDEEQPPERPPGRSPAPTSTDISWEAIMHDLQESRKIYADVAEDTASITRHSKIRLPFGRKYKKKAKKDSEPSLSSTPPDYFPMSPHYAPTQPDYALTPANYSPSSPRYSLSGNYTPGVPDLPPSLPRGGCALVLGSDDDLNFQQTANITHQDFSYQVTNNCTSELAVSFKTEDSVIFVEIPEVHFDGVVGENSCNITKLAELHDVSITRADSEEAERHILMKLKGSSIDTQRAKEEILKLIEFQELFGALMAGGGCN